MATRLYHPNHGCFYTNDAEEIKRVLETGGNLAPDSTQIQPEKKIEEKITPKAHETTKETVLKDPIKPK